MPSSHVRGPDHTPEKSLKWTISRRRPSGPPRMMNSSPKPMAVRYAMSARRSAVTRRKAYGLRVILLLHRGLHLVGRGARLLGGIACGLRRIRRARVVCRRGLDRRTSGVHMRSFAARLFGDG